MLSRPDLIEFLDAHGVEHATLDHPAVFRVGEGEEIKAALPGAHTKNLLLKDSKGQLWLISAEQSSVIDLKRLPAAIGSGRLSFGSAELMKQVLGVTPGSVTAFALINDTDRRVRFVLDLALARAERVNFHPLTNTATTAVSRQGFAAFLAALGVTPMVVDFTSPQVSLPPLGEVPPKGGDGGAPGESSAASPPPPLRGPPPAEGEEMGACKPGLQP